MAKSSSTPNTQRHGFEGKEGWATSMREQVERGELGPMEAVQKAIYAFGMDQIRIERTHAKPE
jgi:hypothetical protein